MLIGQSDLDEPILRLSSQAILLCVITTIKTITITSKMVHFVEKYKSDFKDV